MGKKDYDPHPAIIKANELAKAIKNSDAFKEKDLDRVQSIIIECNEIIINTTKLNYGAICKPRSSC